MTSPEPRSPERALFIASSEALFAMNFDVLLASTYFLVGFRIIISPLIVAQIMVSPVNPRPT